MNMRTSWIPCVRIRTRPKPPGRMLSRPLRTRRQQGQDESVLEELQDEVNAAKEAYDDAISDYNSLYNEYERLEETYKTQKSNARDDMEYARESYELVTGGEDGEGSASYTIQQALNTYEAAVEALENANVTAPVSGTIVSKSVEESDMASPTTAAYVIQTDGEQVVNFDVSAEAASALSLGDEVTIIYGGNEYAAVVTELSVQADETTGLFSVTAQPPGGSGNRPHRHRCQGARFHRQGGGDPAAGHRSGGIR